MIAIIDYGMGNLGSIKNMLGRLGAYSVISHDRAVIESATKLILPGVGAFDAAMNNLRELDLIEPLNDLVKVRKIPILGICLGMQLLTNGSEEGSPVDGFGWIPGRTKKFVFPQENLRLPHMGWNQIQIQRESDIFRDLPADPRFYFVHTYCVHCDDPADVLATAQYGASFHAAIQHGNVIGTQFHPEKSHQFGKAVLRNFVEKVPA